MVLLESTAPWARERLVSRLRSAAAASDSAIASPLEVKAWVIASSSTDEAREVITTETSTATRTTTDISLGASPKNHFLEESAMGPYLRTVAGFSTVTHPSEVAWVYQILSSA